MHGSGLITESHSTGKGKLITNTDVLLSFLCRFLWGFARQVLGMIHAGSHTFLQNIIGRNEVLLANGLTNALAGDPNPSFSAATISLCQKMCQGVYTVSEICLERQEWACTLE